MKDWFNKILPSTANIILGAVVLAAGLASLGGLYQPKEPKNFNVVVMRHFGSK